VLPDGAERFVARAQGPWAQATFGRSFDTASEGSLVAQLGLSVNLSRERYSLDR
jgi:hypothetical protein